MASIQPHGDGFRAQVYVNGRRQSKVLPTRKEAAQWALEREAELSGAKLPDKTYKAACAEYRAVEGRSRNDRIRLLRFEREDAMALRRLAALDPGDFNAWRDARLKQVKPGTVAREMNLLRSVLEHARVELRWIRANPMDDVRWPKCPKGRAKGVPADAIVGLAKAFKVWDRPLAVTKRNRVGLAFLFAIETAMRSGEICALRWTDVHLAERYLTVLKSKNGDARDVPLSTYAVDLLKSLPRGFGPVFRMTDKQRDAVYRKHRPEAWRGVHFHDTRSEGISRLSKKMDVLELARVVGQRDINSLMHYYRADVTAIARRLG